MADVLAVAPGFDTSPFRNLLPSLEKYGVSCADLLVLDAGDVSKRAHVPVCDVRLLSSGLLFHLHASLDASPGVIAASTIRRSPAGFVNDRSTDSPWTTISTLDEGIDNALGGGFPTRYLSEVTGESGVGKTQLLLTLLLSVQLPAPRGLARPAVYISTEAALQTNRVAQILACNPALTSISVEHRPSLSRIFSIQLHDLETQDHILNFQLPVLVRREKVGLIVIDSITANYRAEFEHGNRAASLAESSNKSSMVAKRSAQMVRLGSILRLLAEEENVAVVVANQVTDLLISRELREGEHIPASRYLPGGPQSMLPQGKANETTTPSRKLVDRLSLEHQQRWFSGWDKVYRDAVSSSELKNPSLGLVWANQLACRVVLHKKYGKSKLPQLQTDTRASFEPYSRHRWFDVVFAPWVESFVSAEDEHYGVEFLVTEAGIRSVQGPSDGDQQPTQNEIQIRDK